MALASGNGIRSIFNWWVQPFADVNDAGCSGEDDFVVVAPFNFEDTAGSVHIDFAIALSIDDRAHHCGARTGTGTLSFAHAALPDALLNIRPINHADEDDIGARRKLGMVFNQGTEPPPIDGVKVVNEDTAVRIAHLQRRHFQIFATYVERIIDNSI